MKPTKPAFNAYRKKVVQKEGKDGISQNTRHGETLIPAGEEQAVVVLPKAKDTHTYEILKTEDMKGNLNFGCGETGFLRGLLLTNNEGLSITPISEGIRSVNLNPDLADGSWVEMLSEGNDWFCWGWAGNIDLVESESPVFRGSKKLDLDDDLLTVAQEAQLGTDPTDPDTDGGGVIDGVEYVLGLNPLDPEDDDLARLDTDNDTFTDEEEVLAGTNWQDINHYPGSTEDTVQAPETIGPTFNGTTANLNIQPLTTQETVEAQIQALIDNSTITAWDSGDNAYKTVTFVISGYPSPAEHNTSFKVTFSATDSLSNTTEIERTYTIADTNAPTITLDGDAVMTVTIGSIPQDPGATATDAYGSPPTIYSSWAVDVEAALEAGTANVEYYAIDSVGNRSASVYRTVTIQEEGTVLDNPPTITITGDNPLIIEAGTLEVDAITSALEGVTADDGEGTPITENIDVSFDPAYSSAHNFDSTITYTVTDGVNDPVTATRSLQVRDTQEPDITLNGEDTITVTEGSIGEDPSATALDDYVGAVSVTSNWNEVINDTTEPGTYTITYSADDGNGNTAQATRTVIIEAAVSEFIEESANLITGPLDSLVNDVLITDSSKLTDDIAAISRFALEEYIPDPSNTATYSIWFKKTGTTLNSGGTAFATLFPIFGHQGNYNNGVGIRMTTAGGILACANLRDNNGSQYGAIENPGVAITDGVWNHFAMSISLNESGNTQVQTVVNGVASDLFTRDVAVTISAGNTADVTFVGANVVTNGNIYADGEFDSFEIVNNVALTVEQMQAIYNAGQGNMMIAEASQIIGTAPTFSGIQENLAIEEGTSLIDVEAALISGVTYSDTEDGATNQAITTANIISNTYLETMVGGDTFNVTYSVTDIDGNETTINKTYNVIEAVIETNIVDVDLFNSSEKIVKMGGSSTTSPTALDQNGTIYELDGTSWFSYYNGVKYDPYSLSTIGDIVPTSPGSLENKRISDISATRTYSIWFKMNTENPATWGQTQVLFVKGSQNIGAGWYITTFGAGGALSKGIRIGFGGGGAHLDSPPDQWSVGNWYHLVVIWNPGGNSKAYLTLGGQPVGATIIDNPGLTSFESGISGTEDVADYHGDNTESNNPNLWPLTIGGESLIGNPTNYHRFQGQLALPKIYHGELAFEVIEALNTSDWGEIEAAEAEAAAISETIVVDADIFNSAEVVQQGGTITQTYATSDKIYSFDGSTQLALYNGFKYDPHAIPNGETTIPALNDGTVDYPARTISDTSRARTYSIWFRASAFGDASSLFWKSGHEANNAGEAEDYWYFIINSNNEIHLANRKNDTRIVYNNGSAFNLGEWYHVVAVWDEGTDSKIYINGEETTLAVGSGVDLGTTQSSPNGALIDEYHGDNTGGAINDTIQRLRIGGDPANQYRFDGDLAYPAIYHGELSAAQIQGLYDTQSAEIAAAPITIPETLIVDDDLFNSAEKVAVGDILLSGSLVYNFDMTGQSPWPSPSESFSYYNGFKYDPWDFSGLGGSIPLLNDGTVNYPARTISDTSRARTYSIWCKPDGYGLNAQTLFWKGGAQSESDDGWFIALLNLGGNNLSRTIRVGNESNGQTLYFDSDENTWTATAWQHIVIVWGATPGATKMYLDGHLIKESVVDLGTWHSSVSGGGSPTLAEYHGDNTEGGAQAVNQQVLRIGSDPTGQFGFDGQLALPKIYHGELTQSQIEGLFTSGRTALIDDGQTGLPDALPE